MLATMSSCFGLFEPHQHEIANKQPQFRLSLRLVYILPDLSIKKQYLFRAIGDKGRLEFEEELRQLFTSLIHFMEDKKNETVLTQVGSNVNKDVKRTDLVRMWMKDGILNTLKVN